MQFETGFLHNLLGYRVGCHDVTAFDWTYNPQTEKYEVSVPAKVHKCGKNPKVMCQTKDTNGTYDYSIISSHAAVDDNGNITVSLVNGFQSDIRIVICTEKAYDYYMNHT